MFWAVGKTKPKIKTKASYIRSLSNLHWVFMPWKVRRWCWVRNPFILKPANFANILPLNDVRICIQSETLLKCLMTCGQSIPLNLVTVSWITSQKCLYIYIKNLHLELIRMNLLSLLTLLTAPEKMVQQLFAFCQVLMTLLKKERRKMWSEFMRIW